MTNDHLYLLFDDSPGFSKPVEPELRSMPLRPSLFSLEDEFLACFP